MSESAKKASPTPIPWHLDPDCLFDDGINTTIVSDDDTHILDIFPTHLHSSDTCWSGEQKANAELIVRAVNAHQALVDALRYALENIQGIADGDDLPSIVIREKGRAALALAEGKP